MSKKAKVKLYGIAPIELLQDKSITLRELKVYISLSSFQGNNETSFPSIEQIAERAGLDKSKVSNSTKSLVEKEWLAKTRRGKCLSNVYECLFPISDLAELANSLNESDCAKLAETEIAKLAETDYAKKANSIVKEQLKEQLNKHIYILSTFWNEQSSLRKHKSGTIEKHIKKKHIDIISEHDIEDIKKAIFNYSIICGGNGQYWFTYRAWTFLLFLERGLEKFLPDADPLNNFKKKGKDEEKPSIYPQVQHDPADRERYEREHGGM